MRDREQIINEILEHTKDCDYNRSQHFIEYQYYDKISRVLNLLQIGSLIVLIIFCSIVIPEFENLNNYITYAIPIILSLIATTAQLIDYFCNFSDLAQQHWLAAQAYARLYRQCQFFPSHYGTSCDDYIMRETASNICNELFDLNLMSPNLSERSYKKVSYLQDKKYPIELISYNNRISQLLPFVETIKTAFANHKIEIISFGSYTKTLHNNDIDIAIVIHSAVDDEKALTSKILDLERQFRRNKYNVDLTLLTPNRIKAPSQIPFINNIKKGKQLYASSGLSNSILDYSFNTNDYKELINTCYLKVKSSYELLDTNDFVNKSYYYIRNVIIYILITNDISYIGEYEMIDNFEAILEEQPYYLKISDLFLSLKKLKDNESSIGIDSDLSTIEKENIYNTIIEVHNKLYVKS